MAISVSVAQLRQVFDLVVQRLEQAGLDPIQLETDLYLIISSRDWEEVEENPAPVIGSLVDDWESLCQATKEAEDGGNITFLDFDRLASILRAISEELVSTK